MKRNIALTYEFLLFLLLTGFVTVIGLVNPAFLSLGTLFDILRNQIVYLLFAFALLPVVIIGGLDVSFVAIASLATFFSRILLITLDYEGGIWLVYVTSILFGTLMGLLVAWLISTFRLNIFALSLGMVPLIHGILTLTSSLFHTPVKLKALAGWNMKWLVTVPAAAGHTGLHVSVLIVVMVLVGLSLFLHYSTLGRSIYAFGSNKSVAIRSGMDSRKIYLTVFTLMGILSAIAGVTSMGLGSGSFEEKYYRIYAMIIVGGASIHGGRGSAVGTCLGVLLVGLINQALVYLRVPTAWSDVFFGLIFLFFAFYQTIQIRIAKR